MNYIDHAINELQKAYVQINEELFSNNLKEIVILIDISNKQNYKNLPKNSKSKIWKSYYKELVITNLNFNGDYKNVLEKLLHQMVHQFCQENNIKDLNKDNKHNRIFKKWAKRYKLKVIKNSLKITECETYISIFLNRYFELLDINFNILDYFLIVQKAKKEFWLIKEKEKLDKESKLNQKLDLFIQQALKAFKIFEEQNYWNEQSKKDVLWSSLYGTNRIIETQKWWKTKNNKKRTKE